MVDIFQIFEGTCFHCFQKKKLYFSTLGDQ
jgi:hypothetical protein